MSKFLVVVSILSSLLLAPTIQADEEGEFSDVLMLRTLYPDFLDLEYFGEMRVVFVGEDAEKLGLDSDELTEFLRLKYKNNFAAFPHKDEIEEGISEELIETLLDEEASSKIGKIIVRVWVVGTDYPIAYHIEITAGSFVDRPYEYENASLGYGSKKNVPDSVKKTINDMVEELAITFFKIRGEL